MERLFANISIRKKLTIVIMLASLLILIMVAGAFIVVESYSSRNQLLAETRTLADSLGAHLKQPLLFNDTTAEKELLSSLNLKNGIRAAYLFNSAGTPVATYLDQHDSQFLLKVIPEDFSRRNQALWTVSEEVRILNNWSHLSLFKPLFYQGQRVGTLYLLSDLDELYGRVSGVVFGVFLAILALLGCSWFLAGKLQRPVSLPLMRLVETMGDVTRQNNYRIRAEKQTEDEIGDLVDGFNRMLTQIELHRDQLEKHQEGLELTVAQRTSELREMIRALRQTKQQLEVAGQAKSQFIASITHELRTPLVGVLGMNELLFRTPLNDEQRALADLVQKSGADLLLLINNILDFSRMEAGKLRLEPTEFDIHLVIETVLEMLAGQAEEKGLQLLSEIPLNAVWRVRGDEVRLKQILLNLVGNAIKFTEQGEVRVCLNCRENTATMGQFEIQVIDTGVGMDDAAQQQIFSAFYQADSTSTRDYGGSGLGLAIVAQLVDLMGGRISLESSIGSGSRFAISLELPVVDQVAFGLPEALLQQRVLICSADYPQHQNLAAYLTALGLETLCVPSVAEAWYQLSAARRVEQPIDLLFCSTNACLPGGKPLYLAIREEPGLRNLHRILLFQSRISVMPVERQETRLNPPLSWGGLCEALVTSWQELHLVEARSGPQQLKATPPVPSSGVKQRLLVAGGGVASRELVRLALQNSSYTVSSAPDLSELLAEKAPEFFAILLDLSFLREEQVRQYLAQQDRGLKTLLFYDHEEQVQRYRSLADICVKKPFDRDQLQAALDSLLAGTVRQEEQG